MDALVVSQNYPLACSRDGHRLQWPDTIDFLLLKQATAGRPLDLFDEDGNPQTVPATADINDIQAAVDDEPGLYMAIPHDANGKRFSPIAYIDLTPEAMGYASAMSPGMTGDPVMGTVVERLFALVEKSQATVEASSMMLRLALENSNGSMVNLMDKVAQSTDALTGAIRVITGMEAISREPAPIVDVEQLATKLDSTIKEASKGDGKSKWAPLVNVGMTMAQKFSQPIIDKQKAEVAIAQAKAMEAEARAIEAAKAAAAIPTPGAAAPTSAATAEKAPAVAPAPEAASAQKSAPVRESAPAQESAPAPASTQPPAHADVNPDPDTSPVAEAIPDAPPRAPSAPSQPRPPAPNGTRPHVVGPTGPPGTASDIIETPDHEETS